MKIDFKKSFLKELKRLNNKKLKDSIYESIRDVELAETSSQIKNIQKLKGYDVYFRIRVGDYRIGIKIEDDLV
jgi:mRNA interferase RelE/StbE